ncbi:MAG TPA: hypothetical protein VND22_03300, partial [Actinomycetota bacterium]|nr:hypothetical protein [Actinomycetota bacterium]
MGKSAVRGEFAGEHRRQFMRDLLRDLQALEQMIQDGLIEEGVRRTGAEQEVFLINSSWHPAPAALELLERLDDPHFTTELGLFNLEFNLEPHMLGGNCLSAMEAELIQHATKLRNVANEVDIDFILTGILPTIHKTDLGLENMTPNDRYLAINLAMTELRGGEYDFYIKGLDELLVTHDSIMLEACNASFQVHLQVGAKEFANFYNTAMALTGPILASCTNSPMLFGRRLWAETRIALFQQSIDVRPTGSHPRESSPRVTFGNGWVKDSVMELYREDVARFRTLVGMPVDEDPFEKLKNDEAPQLKALRLHNGTVYRWNRACYGLTDGKPHLRIENRVMPSGPSFADEVANAAFWLGMMQSFTSEFEDITKAFEFEHAHMNFLSAARQGLGAPMTWSNGDEIPAQRLILDELLPRAADGLDQRGIDPADRDRYLGIMEQRISMGRTGSRWILHSLAGMKARGTVGQRLNTLVAATVERQKDNHPVALWDLAHLEEIGAGQHNYFKISQYMQTDVISVQPDESAFLVANLMEWERLRHIPVESSDNKLV